MFWSDNCGRYTIYDPYVSTYPILQLEILPETDITLFISTLTGSSCLSLSLSDTIYTFFRIPNISSPLSVKVTKPPLKMFSSTPNDLSFRHLLFSHGPIFKSVKSSTKHLCPSLRDPDLVTFQSPELSLFRSLRVSITLRTSKCQPKNKKTEPRQSTQFYVVLTPYVCKCRDLIT